jgi:uncharacterized protein
MLSDQDFKHVSLGDRDLFREHYERFPQVHSDNTFTNMVCWNHYAHYRYAYCEGNIIISSTFGDGKPRYRPPIGPRNPELLAEIMTLAAKNSEEIAMVILDPVSREWISELYPQLKVIPERNYFDYVYKASDLAELPGKRYQTMRKQLNQFQRDCSPKLEPITEENLDEMREFLDLWCDWKDCDSDPLLASEEEALLYAITHYTELQLSGLAIVVEGKVGAIAIFEGLNKDTAVVHFEKGLPDCKGIYRAINSETAKLLANEYAFINHQPGERYGHRGYERGQEQVSSRPHGRGAPGKKRGSRRGDLI